MLSRRSCLAGYLPAFSIFVAILASDSTTSAQQGFIASSMSRPFVTGLEPIVGRRGQVVGGILVDSKGVLKRAKVGSVAQLRRLRQKHLKSNPLPTNLTQRSQLRKVSLRKLEEEIYRLRKRNLPLTDEVRLLAGLQTIQYVFVAPEKNDIILAGFAEGWKVAGDGEYVGASTGRPLMNLDDLLIALRTAEAATQGRGISCSIDPTEEGIRRFTKLASRLRGSGKSVARRIARAVGKQHITITGVPRASHFARVLVAADYRMKCLAMALEKSPVAQLPSYMAMLQSNPQRAGDNLMPRWWMEPRFKAIRHDQNKLTWEFTGSSVQVLSELDRNTKDRRQAGQVKEWADLMTRHYDELARHIPTLGKLQNCMNLAVVGALIAKEQLHRRAKNPLHILFDKKNVKFTPWSVPSQIDSQASFVQRAGQTIVSVSGGVTVNSWKPLERTTVKPQLAQVRRKIGWKARSPFWWD